MNLRGTPLSKIRGSTSPGLATKKDLGPFKIDRAVVDSNRSVNLPFDIRKILSLYLSSEEKRY